MSLFRTKSVAEIGQELSVDYLVESSIRGEGARLRVTVTLIRVRDQEHVWSQFYDREPTSLLGLQLELSAAIAEQIRLRLSPDRMSGLGRRQTLNADAYDATLRGRYQSHRRTSDGNAQAIFAAAATHGIRVRGYVSAPSPNPLTSEKRRCAADRGRAARACGRRAGGPGQCGPVGSAAGPRIRPLVD